MCGIVGLVGHAGLSQADVKIVRRMSGTIAHRGPDDEGIWIDPEAGIALAQRQLSIVDLSPAGHQPMFSEDGRYALVFNGEIYNYAALRVELDATGPHRWRGHSDTEVLLAAIDGWGLKPALGRCVGMFAWRCGTGENER